MATDRSDEPPVPAPPRRVLVFSISWLPGQVDGVAVRMMGHVRELSKRGTEVILATPDFVPPGEVKPIPQLQALADVKRHVALETARVPVYRKTLCMRLSFRNLLTLVQVIRAEKPEYIHATQDASLLVVTVAALLCDVPLVISMHTDVSQTAVRDQGFSPLGGLLGRLHARLAVAFTYLGYRVWALAAPTFLAVSEQAKLNLRTAGVPEHCVYSECWGPAVDRTTFRIDLPEDEVAACRRRLTFGLPDAYLLVYVGRVLPEKDIQFLVDALERMPQNVVLALIGPGQTADELKKSHGPRCRLYCTGEFASREQVALSLRAADCAVSASTNETVGFVALESISCGTPFLAARAQGFAMHLAHGINSRLWTPFDPGSFDEELAAMMATKREGCWSRKALRATMESASIQMCTNRALRAYVSTEHADARLLRLGVMTISLSLNWLVAVAMG